MAPGASFIAHDEDGKEYIIYPVQAYLPDGTPTVGVLRLNNGDEVRRIAKGVYQITIPDSTDPTLNLVPVTLHAQSPDAP